MFRSRRCDHHSLPPLSLPPPWRTNKNHPVRRSPGAPPGPGPMPNLGVGPHGVPVGLTCPLYYYTLAPRAEHSSSFPVERTPRGLGEIIIGTHRRPIETHLDRPGPCTRLRSCYLKLPFFSLPPPKKRQTISRFDILKLWFRQTCFFFCFTRIFRPKYFRSVLSTFVIVRPCDKTYHVKRRVLRF